MEQVQAACAEMRWLQSEGKLQNLPPACVRGGGVPSRQLPSPTPSGKRQIGA
jgi:hypothetical protein